MKVKFFDKILLINTGRFVMLIGSILSVIALFEPNFISDNKMIIITIITIITLLNYIIKYVYVNRLKFISLNIHGSTFDIKEGNIFEETGLKVINFNEYFDTLVDNRIIAENSLNGEYILKIIKDQINDLDKEIDEQLIGKHIEENVSRARGKTKKYNLGEIVEYSEYILTSLTKYTKDNRAVLSLKEYLTFSLVKQWKKQEEELTL